VRYFEDLTVGERGETHRQVITEDAIVAFAREYDPQPFHVDPGLAQTSIWSGLVASGLQSLALVSRLVIDDWLGEIANLGSPGLEPLNLRLPVRPDDEIRGEWEVLSMRPSRSHPERGVVRYQMKLLNHREEVVLDTVAVILVSRQTPWTDAPTSPAGAA